MPGFFQRGSTPPGGRDGTPFNNTLNRAESLNRANEARATNPYTRFQPEVPVSHQRIIVRAPTGTPSQSSEGVANARTTLNDQGPSAATAQTMPGGPLPPGLRQAAARARAAISRRQIGEYGIPIGGQPSGPQVGHTTNQAPERPLPLSIHRRAPTNLPPR